MNKNVLKYLSISSFILSVNPVYSQTKKVPQLKSGGYVQEETGSFKFKDQIKTVTLNGAIEQGLRENYEQQKRKYEDKILELNWTDSKHAFWYPQISLQLTSSSQRVGRIKKGEKTGGTTSPYPSGNLAFVIEDYTVFNWGKDYLEFLNSKETYLRGKQKLLEKRRILKHSIINAFFETIMYKKISAIKKEQLRHTSFIYSMNREKVTLKKVSKREYYQSRAEYLRSQSEYFEAKRNTGTADETLAILLKDPVGTIYIFRERLKYIPMKTTFDEALKYAKKDNLNIKDAKVAVHIAKRSHDIVQRENLPLPKFSINLGAYTHSFSTSTYINDYETNSNNSNIELVASIAATWALTGKDGLFNTRKTTLSYTARELAEKNLEQAKHESQSTVRSKYYSLTNLQNELKVLDARITTLQKLFDTVLDDYLKKRTDFQDFRLALIEQSTTEAAYETLKFLHLKAKLELAETMGQEDFPGQNFENLAIREKGK
ncbi:MAG: TolC family protein [Bacteriovoracaceae bacterium]|nr:TolC family protein [Bacteriovoracaceae bacterium]